MRRGKQPGHHGQWRYFSDVSPSEVAEDRHRKLNQHRNRMRKEDLSAGLIYYAEEKQEQYEISE